MTYAYVAVTQRLNKLSILHRIVMQPRLQAYDLYRGQPPVLHYLTNHEGCTQAEIATAMGISPASIAKTLASMERRGLIERHPDKDDRRANIISTTGKGVEAEMNARRVFSLLDEELYAGISDKQLTQCAQTLEKMIVNLTGRPSDDITFDELMIALKVPKQKGKSTCTEK